MKLEPQNAQEAEKPESKGKVQKEKTRERRRAPEFTLVWSEEAWPVIRSLSAPDIGEVRKKAMSRIFIVEAALRGDPAVVSIASAKIETVAWSKFNVGAYWFCLEFRDAPIREYVVMLADPPSPGDIPPPPPRIAPKTPGASMARKSATKRRSKKDGDGSNAARPAAAKRLIRQADAEHAMRVVWRFARRELNCGLMPASIKLRTNLLLTFDRAMDACGNSLNDIRVAAASLERMSLRFARIIRTGKASFTQTRELPAQPVGSGARLEPRWVGHESGLRVLINSWIWDDLTPVDWSANLFGASPIDWSANLFGVKPEEKRAFI